MNIAITPGRLQGCVTPPPSKSDVQRLLIAAALADVPSRMRLNTPNEDIAAMIRCLEALGAGIAEKEDALEITPIAASCRTPRCDCGESGATLRFLTPVAAALDGAVFTGCGRLKDRPMEPLLSLLRAHGSCASGEGLPLLVPGGLQSGEYALPGDVSSQYVTGLLFALPLLAGDSRIHLTTPLQSRGYADMTLRTLRRFGIAVEETEIDFVIPGGQKYTAPGEKLIPEGDWSGAAFWYGANYLGSSIDVRGLAADSIQGDRLIAEFSEKLPDVIDVSDIPDLVPVLSVMACKKTGETKFVNAARLRIKESDRLTGCRKMILSLGGCAEETEDTLTVRGRGMLCGGTVDGLGDHRIVMSAAIASCLCTQEVVILGAEHADKSYPAFLHDFEQLGGKYHVL